MEMTQGDKREVLCYLFKNYFQPSNGGEHPTFASFYSLPTIHYSRAGATP
jgi:hypothetical protein